MKIRSLYDCFNARYPAEGGYIFCSKGHKLGQGRVHKRQVDRGDRLVFKICQLCRDFEGFDKPFEW